LVTSPVRSCARSREMISAVWRAWSTEANDVYAALVAAGESGSFRTDSDRRRWRRARARCCSNALPSAGRRSSPVSPFALWS
jgi:hypothetical protein